MPAIHLEIAIVGITIGTYEFNLNDGLTIEINLLVVSGKLRFYGENGNELWLQYKSTSPFGSWEDDVKVISW